VRYLALGDSISIDDYTEVPGGGAASQFAAKIGAEGARFVNLTRVGNTTLGVLMDLDRVSIQPEIVTLTAGGNDFLLGRSVEEVGENLESICERLTAFGCAVILNTVYDPTDGCDKLGARLGLSPEKRVEFSALNWRIRTLARARGFMLGDLETLFQGNGIAASPTWFVHQIEPNLLGATATAAHWLGLYRNWRHSNSGADR
jgi:hypothetical protein